MMWGSWQWNISTQSNYNSFHTITTVTHTQPFNGPLCGTTRVGWYRRDIHPLTPETCCGSLSSFWILWGVGKITEASVPTIRLDATPFGQSMPPPPSSRQFYAGCHSCHNSPNLSWLGTGTEYAGLHNWRLVCSMLHISENNYFSIFFINHSEMLNLCQKWSAKQLHIEPAVTHATARCDFKRFMTTVTFLFQDATDTMLTLISGFQVIQKISYLELQSDIW